MRLRCMKEISCPNWAINRNVLTCDVVRYLGLPTPDDNLAGYQASDVTSKAKKLDGKKFLIVHGTAGMTQTPAYIEEG